MTEEQRPEDPDLVPVSEEGDETPAPRREKSAEFEVRDETGDAGFHDAMDPANQSLADALRLSYRVLQLAILGLAVVFLFSGFQTVRDNSTGVRTLFGRIVGDGVDRQVTSGLQAFWPYPVGEIVQVPMKRTIVMNNSFFPSLRVRDQRGTTEQSLEDAIGFAAVSKPIRPGGDGSLILKGGDLGHCRITADYSVDDAVSFLEKFTPVEADEVVRLAIERSTVHVAATLDLEEFVDDRDRTNSEIRSGAQATLDQLDAGIRISNVNCTDRMPPFAVAKSVQGVQEARERAKTVVTTARQDGTQILDDAAGASAFEEIVAMIAEYETEISRGDPEAADKVLARIGARFDKGDISGEAATTLTRARAYRSMIESGLGTFARRVDSLSASYRENPRQLVRQLWLSAYRDVLEGPEVEVISAPPGLGSLALRMKSSNEVSNARRDGSLQRRTNAAMKGTDLSGFQLGSRQISIDKAGRRLQRDASGGFGREEGGE
ncbi:MAG: hypothetical protein CMJ67_06235 [Planctomycetaceae bacterium]|nr:hypothetical protein [Planctomycetaceae bacterium]